MADKSVDSIEEQIRRLTEEKEEIERINREKQQQEHRARLMKENVSTPRTSGGTSYRETNRDFGDLSEDLSATLVESQARIRSMQQSFQSLSKDGALNDSRDASHKSSDDADEDVMSQEHKQALRANRDVLVENMTPDDIFNDLISKHILTNTDVSRIKDRNTTEAINEELLNVLIRRSDRAFHVFVASLRRTLQAWLANRIDPDSQQRNKRKRKSGEIDVNFNCERIVPVSKKRHTCTCQEVEEQLLIMAKGAFSHIRRRDGTSSSFEQFKKELKQTNEAIMETMETVNALKILCRHGEITDMTEGSVCFTISCSSLTSCQALWEAYESGTLLRACQKGLVTPVLLRICGAKQIHLRVRMSRLEYLTCALELAINEKNVLERQHRPAHIKKLYSSKTSLAQDENRPGELTKLFPHKKGQVFTEIPLNTLQHSHPPGVKGYVNGYDRFTSSPRTLSLLPVSERHLSPENILSQVRSVEQYTFGTEQSKRTDMWLRSHGKDTASSEKCVFNKIPGYTLNQQLTQRCQESVLTSRHQDAYPYNLRHRFLNHNGSSI